MYCGSLSEIRKNTRISTEEFDHIKQDKYIYPSECIVIENFIWLLYKDCLDTERVSIDNGHLPWFDVLDHFL